MAAARVIPGVWAVFVSRSRACTIFTPFSFQSNVLFPNRSGAMTEYPNAPSQMQECGDRMRSCNSVALRSSNRHEWYRDVTPTEIRTVVLTHASRQRTRLFAFGVASMTAMARARTAVVGQIVVAKTDENRFPCGSAYQAKASPCKVTSEDTSTCIIVRTSGTT